MRYNDQYDTRYLWSRLVWILVVFTLMRFTVGAGFLIVVPTAFAALFSKKSESLFFWLLLTICTLIANPNLVVKGMVYSLAQRGMMVALGGCMTLLVFGQMKHRIMKPFLFMLIYVAFMVLPSAMGWCPMISFLKLFLFSAIFMSFWGVANQVAMRPMTSERQIRSILLAVGCLFIFGSVALLPFPSISQYKGDEYIANSSWAVSLFMGMTNHSQCLGPVISSLSVVLFADLLFSVKRMDKLYLTLLACCPYLIYKTSSRTGMGAYILGMAFVAYCFMKAHRIESRWKSRVSSLLVVVVFIGGVGLMCSQGAVRKFALKFNAEDGVEVSTANVFSSRQALVDHALENFKKKPMIGNGFQVVENLQNRGWGFSLLSAPVEKGVWYAAVLEEGGAIGFLIFTCFLVTCIFGSIRRRAYAGGSCLFVFMLTNFGEFTFFSMSYSGGFGWAMVFAGLALDGVRLRREQYLGRR